MHPAGFFWFLSLTAVWGWALHHPGWGTVAPVVFIFGLVPAIDFVIGTTDRNPDAAERRSWAHPRVWTTVVYTYVLTHFAVLGFALWSTRGQPWWIVVGVGVVTGLYTGGLGITVAHELGHKPAPVHQFTAAALLATVWYHHFLIEHTRGHHVRVATPEDPASATLDETAYRFLARSIRRSFISARALERRRVGATWTSKNQITVGLIAQVLITVGVAAAGGAGVLSCFLIQSAVAIALLELINYIEHYGLSRARTAAGRYARVAPEHSWNSSHRVTNAIFFNLQRHSDHHATSILPFTILKHHADVPQLPYGYPTMVLIALCPPLWFAIMNPRVSAWRSRARAAPAATDLDIKIFNGGQ